MIIFLIFFILSSTIDLHGSLNVPQEDRDRLNSLREDRDIRPHHTVVEVGTDSFEQAVVARNIAQSTQAINRLSEKFEQEKNESVRRFCFYGVLSVMFFAVQLTTFAVVYDGSDRIQNVNKSL